MKISLLLILLILSCCSPASYHSMNKFRESAIESATNNSENFSSNQENLFQHHERAKSQWIDLNGNVVKSYSHSERKLGLLSYVPLLSFFLPRNYENYEVIITFKNAAIADVQSFYGIITLESESNCHEAIFSCVTKAK